MVRLNLQAKKRCTKCSKFKPITIFGIRKTVKDRLECRCNPCKSEDTKLWYHTNREQARIRRKAYYATHRERENKLSREYKLEYRDDVNSKNVVAYLRRYNSDPDFRLRHLLRKRLWHALNGHTKVGSAVRDLGCSMDEFKIYIASKFQPGMTWDNWGWGPGKWNIDHIRPLVSFNLIDREQLLKACHYTNLQPMWFEENMVKGASCP